MIHSLLKAHSPLQILGVPNAYTALMAQEEGFRCLYLSGAAVSNLCFGLPDVGVTTLNDVAEECRRITSAVKIPLIVDIDTGWGNEKMIDRAIKTLIQAGASGIHIEDQQAAKVCGHLPSKKLVSADEMTARVAAVVKARGKDDLYIIARTDALAEEEFDSVVRRAMMYSHSGADAIFAEAFTELVQYNRLKAALRIPILANSTEFGKTPIWSLKEFAEAGVDMVLYPLSCSRAMNAAALGVMKTIKQKGSQKDCLENMQTREEHYRFLKYQPKKS